MWDPGVSSYGQHSEHLRKVGKERKREGAEGEGERAQEHKKDADN